MPPVISKLASDECQICHQRFAFGDPVLTDRDGDGALAVHERCAPSRQERSPWRSRGSKGEPLSIVGDIRKPKA